ncbi:MAG TPA: response regulator transcription factor [Lachnospiraceae bacterium]|nr:response regulator transcription factor [Lachnospiraceae bacterium]
MDQEMKILVVDDDAEIREVIRILLESEGCKIVEAGSGTKAVELMDDTIQLIIMDVMMPGISGIRACEIIREKYVTPVLFLTAKSADTDKVLGFSAGGDDYLVKPFSYTELLSRVKALFRRCYQYNGLPKTLQSNVVFIHDLQIDLDKQCVIRNDQEIELTEIEYQILTLLATNRKKVFSVQNIYESVWKEPYFSSSTNTVTVHIRNLRKKLEPDFQESMYIQNVWGRGYRVV